MCLSSVTQTYANPSGLIIDGWKEFNGTSRLPNFPHQGGVAVLDTWLRASETGAPTGIVANDNKKYQAGFHVYADEREVKGLGYRRVFVRFITCEGDQGRKKCLVAQEMYVPSDPNAWPPLTPAPPTPQSTRARVKRLFKPKTKPS